MPTIEIPDYWAIFTPAGEFDGWVRSQSGGNVQATAEQAHAFMVPNKRTREAERRKGVTLRGVTTAELQELLKPPAATPTEEH